MEDKVIVSTAPSDRLIGLNFVNPNNHVNNSLAQSEHHTKQETTTDYYLNTALSFFNPFHNELNNALVKSEQYGGSEWMYSVVVISGKMKNRYEEEIINSDIESLFCPSVWKTFNEEEKELLKMCRESRNKIIFEKYGDHINSGPVIEQDKMQIENEVFAFGNGSKK